MNQQQYLDRALALAQDIPVAAEAIRLQRPIFMAQVRAMAAMFALRDEESGLAAEERFIKARDATIIADAANKGILHLAKSAQVQVSILNRASVSVTLDQGRLLYDDQGLLHRLLAQVTIAAGETVLADLRQQQIVISNTTITVSQPFTRVAVPQLDADYYLEDLSVQVNGTPFIYAPDYLNVAAGDPAYQVEIDLNRVMSVRFGANTPDGIPAWGRQLQIGDVVRVEVIQTAGRIQSKVGSSMGLDYAVTAQEEALTFTIDSIASNGADPLTIRQLQDLCRYPSMYDHDAVYLSNYDALLRRYMPDAQFIGVSTEQVEDRLGRATLDSIRALYVSAHVEGESPSSIETTVRNLIGRSDNAKRVIMRPVVEIAQELTIIATVPANSNQAQVQTAIKQSLLAKYGRGQPIVGRGGYSAFLSKDIQKLLEQDVAILREPTSDIKVVLPEFQVKPEEWRYLTESSINVQVELAKYGGGGTWNF